VIDTIEIRNFKSIEQVEISLGRINVFIGENGAGKSNLLEAIALAGAANAGKLDTEFLMSRGIRVTQPQLMRPRFDDCSDVAPIEVSITSNDETTDFKIENDNTPYSNWSHTSSRREITEKDFVNNGIKEFIDLSPENKAAFDKAIKVFVSEITKSFKTSKNKKTSPNKVRPWETASSLSDANMVSRLLQDLHANYKLAPKEIDNFVIYSPENTALRTFEKEGQIEPLGVNGEGLLKLLEVLSTSENELTMIQIDKALKLLGWFKSLKINPSNNTTLASLEVHDKFLADDKAKLDQRSVNEGFFFLLFYASLFASDLTPTFFAIDNIDASLNPKLCSKLMLVLNDLAEANNKQVLLTTHNPAILDGLNINDDDQRLFVITRDLDGYTQVSRVQSKGKSEFKLSEMFMRGLLGGLPKRF
jgi:AAA15 family ATPase/GTPase